ncbi:MAG: 3'(2'),5'-bisphosphate nucleotidase CysQ [Actinomycetota bacterium]
MSGPGKTAGNDDLERIERALAAAVEVLRRFTPGAIESTVKAGGSPVTEADHLVDATLRELLPRDGEGWLSEESVDDRSRLECSRVWIVDPLDGTKEFVQGLPEWCCSIGLVVDGRPVAGGIANPATDEFIVGSLDSGVTLNGTHVRTTGRTSLEGAVVLASRSETDRGEWDRFSGYPFEWRPMGSVAYKLGLVAAGLVDATWTLVPKHEWDVAAGAALVEAAGGAVTGIDGQRLCFNTPTAHLMGMIATAPGIAGAVAELLGTARA